MKKIDHLTGSLDTELPKLLIYMYWGNLVIIVRIVGFKIFSLDMPIDH